MTIVSPSILSADFTKLGADCRMVLDAGAQMLHYDVMDGHFVPNLTFGVPIIAALRKHVSIPFDAHLMVEHPDVYVDGLAKAGVQYVTVHQEACPHLDSTLQHIRNAGMKCGVALNPATPVSSLSCVAAQLDMILIMSVNPGFGGQKFIPGVLRKIREVRALADRHFEETGHAIRVEVDGGVKTDNIGEIARAGADTFVAGSAIFGRKSKEGYREVIEAMRAAVKSVQA